MTTITKYKHEIMWWMSRLTIMLSALFLSFSLAASARAAEIQMGSGGMLVFEPCELTIQAGDTVTFILCHLPFVKPEVSKAQLGIALDGIPVWSMEVDLPAEATVYQSEFIVPADAHRAETLTIHVDNHGSNSWRFYTFEYAR